MSCAVSLTSWSPRLCFCSGRSTGAGTCAGARAMPRPGGAMPGDELMPDPSFNAIRATTIDAPPEAVWPWLVQLGYAHAGWYSYDLFDKAKREAHPVAVPRAWGGNWVPMSSRVNETTAPTPAFERNWARSPRMPRSRNLVSRAIAPYARQTESSALSLSRWPFTCRPLSRRAREQESPPRGI
jgi:hypothetical protein